jgi:hypothetical protein
MDKAKQLRDQIRLVTGQRWTPARVEALLEHLGPAEALRAVERANRLSRTLQSAKAAAK